MSYLTMLGITVLVILFSIGLLAVDSLLRNDEGAPTFFGIVGLVASTIWIFAGMIVAIPFSINHQISDVENIQYQKEKIEIQYDRLDRLSSLLEKFDYPEASTLANADTPIGSVVSEMSAVEKDIAQRRERVAAIKRDIRERRAWIYGFVTNWYPLKE